MWPNLATTCWSAIFAAGDACLGTNGHSVSVWWCPVIFVCGVASGLLVKYKKTATIKVCAQAVVETPSAKHHAIADFGNAQQVQFQLPVSAGLRSNQKGQKGVIRYSEGDADCF